MTLEDIERIPKNFLTAVDVAPYIGTGPKTLRYQAHTKSRVKIPKDIFVQHFRGIKMIWEEQSCQT